MAEQKIAGETIIEDEVVASIVGIAAMEVEGVAHLGKASIRRSLTERLAPSMRDIDGILAELVVRG